jgi:hypothetical protein
MYRDARRNAVTDGIFYCRYFAVFFRPTCRAVVLPCATLSGCGYGMVNGVTLGDTGHGQFHE